MTDDIDFIDDPIGTMDLTDLEGDQIDGGSTGGFLFTIWISTFQHSLCGSCGVFSVGCC